MSKIPALKKQQHSARGSVGHWETRARVQMEIPPVQSVHEGLCARDATSLQTLFQLIPFKMTPPDFAFHTFLCSPSSEILLCLI